MNETRYIMAGSFIDGSGAGMRRNVFLEVKDGVISDIGPAAGLSRDHGTVIDDLSHCTILPALIDCSVFLLHSPSVDEVQPTSAGSDPAAKTSMMARHIGYCHAHGVLGVVESEDISDHKKHYQEGMTRGSLVDIRTPGSDFIRIDYSGNIDDGDVLSPRPGPADLCRILRRKGGKKAVVVANGARQVAEALAAGCDVIEQGYGMGEENLRQMAQKNVLWIPSALRAKNRLDGSAGGGSVCCRFSQRYVAPGKAVPGAEAFWKKTLAGQLAQLRLARKLGVKTAVGTGAGSFGILHGESMVEEMKLFIKAGFTLEEIIRCASENGAGFFGMDDLGALAVDRKATFLVSRGSVPQLPRKLSYLEGVYINGKPSAAYRKNPF